MRVPNVYLRSFEFVTAIVAVDRIFDRTVTDAGRNKLVAIAKQGTADVCPKCAVENQNGTRFCRSCDHLSRYASECLNDSFPGSGLKIQGSVSMAVVETFPKLLA